MSTSVLGYRDIIGQFYNALQNARPSWLDQAAMLFQSNQPSETYKWLGMAPQMREWVGSRMLKNLADNGLTIVNKEFEASLIIPIRDMQRDKSGQISVRVADLARRANDHYAKLLSTLITNGTGATSGLCYDGQYFFDTDHSEGDSGSQYNVLTSSQVAALNVGTATAPTAAEAVNAVLGVIAYMMNYKDDQGEPINGDARNFLVMTSPALMAPFAAALSNPVVDSGATNTLVNLDGFNISLAINPRLAFTTQFVVIRTDASAKAFIMQEERPIQAEWLGEGSDFAFDNNAYKFGVKASRNVGYGMWQYAAHATLS